MKTCPDCAESIQDAARKCRHCGYRYDEEGVATAALAAEPAAAASPRKKPTAKAKPPAEPAAARAPEPAASAAAPAAAAATAPATGAGIGAHLTLAIGGVLFALSALVLAVSALSGPQSPIGGVGMGGLGLSGLVIALGWGILVPRGKGSVAAALSGLAIPAALVAAMMEASGLSGLSLSANAADRIGNSLFVTVLFGPLILMAVHYVSLEALVDYVIARLGAAVAAIGIGYEVVTTVRDWHLPDFLDVIAIILAIGGSILFGAGLTLGAVVAARE